MKVLIIGGVAAGATAAARIRRLNGDVEITLLEAGGDVSFANCGLPYFLGGDIEHRSSLILASPETFHDQYRVDVHLNTRASSIDRKKKIVRALKNGEKREKKFPYDVLILAQGGKPIVPPLPGVEQENVFQLWTLDDMDAIDSYIRSHEPRTAVVVGGGFIGLEMVEALAHRGLKVELVELASQVMPNLETEIAGALTRELQENGIALHLGKSLKAVEGEEVLLEDGTRLPAEMVLLSVGVRPSLDLAKDAGLEIGPSGGLKVNEELQTSDPSIYAAGDMAEIEHRLLDRTVRMPLAGPANRQGRIVAENALGGSKRYRGALGSSIVKLFDLSAGSTGLSLSEAKKAGFDADAVVVHKVSHTAYYPGAEKLTLMLIFEISSGKVLGAQAAGKVGVDKRLDVIATAVAGGLTIEDLEELDLAYAPPFNSPNGPVNMAAFASVNHRCGFSRSVSASGWTAFMEEHSPVLIDLRDPITFREAAIKGSLNLSQNMLRREMKKFKKDQVLLLISDDGQKGHVALRMLSGAGFGQVFYLSGGYISLERFARTQAVTGDFAQPLLGEVGLFPVSLREPVEEPGQKSGSEPGQEREQQALEPEVPDDSESTLIVDVRTPEEFAGGAYPGAVNLPLDQLPGKIDQLGDRDREIVVYCASGARSAYAMRLLHKLGFTRVENGGGLHDMMTRD
jgi:NADPH-dependent 2,4-dienoyl-CoA reductase/sulfur reductase-like enzyme/rhodanese-related sulfurtransferase